MGINFKSVSLVLIIAVLVACKNTPTGFQLKGKLDNTHGETIVLEQMSPDGLKKIDSAVINPSGEFTMTPAINDIGFFRLKLSDRNFATFIFEGDQSVSVTGDAGDLGNTYKVEGSPDTKLFLEINEVSAKDFRKRDSIQKVFQAFVNTVGKDTARIDSLSNILEKPFNELVSKHNEYLLSFIEKHLSSFASLVAIQQLPPEQFMSTYEKLDESLLTKYPNSLYTKSFHESLASHDKVSIGATAPEITLNTPDEKSLSLSSLRGKIVLVDFWASWCRPCRGENPNVVAAYKKYNSKGFEVFSVSLDNDLDKWKYAIEADHLEWKNHVCDFKGWESPIVKLYNFNSIPSNVLIDKDGKILAKNLRGEELEKKLSELIK